MTRRLLALLVVTIPLVVGCTGPTGYREAGFTSDYYGYRDQALSSGEIAVTARGNAKTSPARVAEIALLRAAHLTLDRKATHFMILEQRDIQRQVKHSVGVPVLIGGVLVPIPVGSSTHREPMAVLLVRPVPADALDAEGAVDARAVITEIEPRFR